MTTVALTVPAVLLWRQKRALGLAGTQPLHARTSVRSGAPPPSRRRTPGPQLEGTKPKSESRQDAGTDVHIGKGLGTSTRTHTRTLMEPKYPPPRRSGSLLKGSQGVMKETKSVIGPRATAASEGSASLVDGPLMSLGAFCIATGAVGLAAAVGIWGVRSMLGVDNVCGLLLSFFIAVLRFLVFSSSLLSSFRIYEERLCQAVV